MEKKAIGRYIAELRIAKGMTQFQLADRLNVPFEAVSSWERGESYPDITLIPVIADVFGVTSDEILRSRVITEIEPETNAPERIEPELSTAGNIETDERLDTAMAKYKMVSGISMGLAALGVILMLVLTYVMQQNQTGFIVCIAFAAAAVLAETVNILRTRLVLREGLTPDSCYETFFKTMPYVFCTAAAAVLLALPVLLDFGLTYPDGTAMTGFVYYLHAARYMALSSLALYAVGLFIADRAVGSMSRYQNISVLPRSKVKPIIWLVAFIVLIAV